MSDMYIEIVRCDHEACACRSTCADIYICVYTACISIYLSIHPSIDLSRSLSLSLSVCLCLSLSLSLSLSPSVYLSIYLSMYLQILLSIYVYVNFLFMSLYVHMYICMCIYIYTYTYKSLHVAAGDAKQQGGREASSKHSDVQSSFSAPMKDCIAQSTLSHRRTTEAAKTPCSSRAALLLRSQEAAWAE